MYYKNVNVKDWALNKLLFIYLRLINKKYENCNFMDKRYSRQFEILVFHRKILGLEKTYFLYKIKNI